MVGTTRSPQKRSRAAGLSKQRTRVLAPVPRGSQLTTSKRPWPVRSSRSALLRTSSTPELPGPPGLKNIEPIRWSGLLARWRITESVIVGPPGRDQSSGTCTRAHCSPSPHAFQAMRSLTASAVGPGPAGAPAAGPASRPSTPIPPRSASARAVRRPSLATR